jgi:hypothetical protein
VFAQELYSLFLNKTLELYLNTIQNIVVEFSILYIIYCAQCTVYIIYSILRLVIVYYIYSILSIKRNKKTFIFIKKNLLKNKFNNE